MSLDSNPRVSIENERLLKRKPLVVEYGVEFGLPKLINLDPTNSAYLQQIIPNFEESTQALDRTNPDSKETPHLVDIVQFNIRGVNPNKVSERGTIVIYQTLEKVSSEIPNTLIPSNFSFSLGLSLKEEDSDEINDPVAVLDEMWRLLHCSFTMEGKNDAGNIIFSSNEWRNSSSEIQEGTSKQSLLSFLAFTVFKRTPGDFFSVKK